jgi:hypothetical protein
MRTDVTERFYRFFTGQSVDQQYLEKKRLFIGRG